MSAIIQIHLGVDILEDSELFITAAGITDATQKAAIRQLVADFKTYAIWSKMLAIYPFIGGAAGTHKYNLKDPRDLDAAHRITFTGTLTHDANGITSNGTTGYGDTNLNGSGESLNNDSHLSVYVRTSNAAGDKTEINAYNGSNAYWSIKARDTGDKTFYGIYRFTADGFIQPSNTDSKGMYTLTRRSSSDAEAYKNGSSVGTTTTTTQSIPNVNVHLCKRSDTTTSFSDRNIAFASIGKGLTGQNAADLYTAVQAFQTTLGRQI